MISLNRRSVHILYCKTIVNIEISQRFAHKSFRWQAHQGYYKSSCCTYSFSYGLVCDYGLTCGISNKRVVAAHTWQSQNGTLFLSSLVLLLMADLGPGKGPDRTPEKVISSKNQKCSTSPWLFFRRQWKWTKRCDMNFGTWLNGHFGLCMSSTF